MTTTAERKMLELAVRSPSGNPWPMIGARQHAGGAKMRMFEKMRQKGLFDRHNNITDAGRDALKMKKDWADHMTAELWKIRESQSENWCESVGRIIDLFIERKLKMEPAARLELVEGALSIAQDAYERAEYIESTARRDRERLALAPRIKALKDQARSLRLTLGLSAEPPDNGTSLFGDWFGEF